MSADGPRTISMLVLHQSQPHARLTKIDSPE